MVYCFVTALQEPPGLGNRTVWNWWGRGNALPIMRMSSACPRGSTLGPARGICWERQGKGRGEFTRLFQNQWILVGEFATWIMDSSHGNILCWEKILPWGKVFFQPFSFFSSFLKVSVETIEKLTQDSSSISHNFVSEAVFPTLVLFGGNQSTKCLVQEKDGLVN